MHVRARGRESVQRLEAGKFEDLAKKRRTVEASLLDLWLDLVLLRVPGAHRQTHDLRLGDRSGTRRTWHVWSMILVFWAGVFPW